MFLARCGQLALLLGLAACGTQQYSAERVGESLVVPPTWQDAPEETQSAAEICRAIGGEAFAPLASRLFAENLEMRAAAARLRQADAVARSARSPLLPRLDLAISGARGDAVSFTTVPLPGSVPGGIGERYQGSLAASYEVDAWGRIRNESRAAALQAEAAAESLAALRLSLAAELADTWIALVAQRELIGVLERQRETAARFLELTRLRFGLGQAGAADVGRQRQQLLSLSGQLGVARGQLAALEDQLAALLGSGPDTLILAAPDRLPPAPALPDPGVPATLAEARPDVRVARLALAAADRRLAAAIGSRMPTLSLDASLLSVDTMVEELFTDSLWQVGAELTANLFDAGQRRATISLRDAEAEEAMADYAGALVSAWTEVATSLALAEARDTLVASLRAQLDEADRVLSLTRDAYLQGQVGFLDVLLAQQSNQSLEQSLVDARRDQYSGRIQLCRALGVSTIGEAPQ